MQNKYNELIAEIDLWQNQLPALLLSNPKIIELAFLKIYVKFEQFLIEAFVHYAIGGEGKNSYKPVRRLAFSDITHLSKILKADGEFIDIKRIQKVADAIFDNFNPFTKFFTDANSQTDFYNMTIVRHFLVHESNESKKKYITIINTSFEEPCVFLSKENQKFYKKYVTTLKNYAGIILECPTA